MSSAICYHSSDQQLQGSPYFRHQQLPSKQQLKIGQKTCRQIGHIVRNISAIKTTQVASFIQQKQTINLSSFDTAESSKSWCNTNIINFQVESPRFGTVLKNAKISSLRRKSIENRSKRNGVKTEPINDEEGVMEVNKMNLQVEQFMQAEMAISSRKGGGMSKYEKGGIHYFQMNLQEILSQRKRIEQGSYRYQNEQKDTKSGRYSYEPIQQTQELKDSVQKRLQQQSAIDKSQSHFKDHLNLFAFERRNETKSKKSKLDFYRVHKVQSKKSMFDNRLGNKGNGKQKVGNIKLKNNNKTTICSQLKQEKVNNRMSMISDCQGTKYRIVIEKVR